MNITHHRIINALKLFFFRIIFLNKFHDFTCVIDRAKRYIFLTKCFINIFTCITSNQITILFFIHHQRIFIIKKFCLHNCTTINFSIIIINIDALYIELVINPTGSTVIIRIASKFTINTHRKFLFKCIFIKIFFCEKNHIIGSKKLFINTTRFSRIRKSIFSKLGNRIKRFLFHSVFPFYFNFFSTRYI